VSRENNRFSSVVLAVVKSSQFQMRVRSQESQRNTTN
jgi:hypothetical protein